MPLLPFLAPAAIFALLAGLVSVTETPRPLFNVLRDLGPEGLAGLTLALTLVGGGAGVAIGRNRACPSCGAWWARVASAEDAGASVREGGHFHGTDGFVSTREVTNFTAYDLVCRKCDHAFTRTRGATQRTFKTPFGSDERHKR